MANWKVYQLHRDRHNSDKRSKIIDHSRINKRKKNQLRLIPARPYRKTKEEKKPPLQEK
jgi:hypothetical protein